MGRILRNNKLEHINCDVRETYERAKYSDDATS
jgi:hypothetical protein